MESLESFVGPVCMQENMFHSAFHLALHFIIPGLIAILFFKKRWRLSWLIMILTMAVDLDHLLANPIYDPNRCSINFHPLHSYFAILLYGFMTVFPKTRLIGLGLLLHMAIDLGDCYWIQDSLAISLSIVESFKPWSTVL